MCMSVKIKEYPKKLFEEDSLLFFGADKPNQDDIDVFNGICVLCRDGKDYINKNELADTLRFGSLPPLDVVRGFNPERFLGSIEKLLVIAVEMKGPGAPNGFEQDVCVKTYLLPGTILLRNGEWTLHVLEPPSLIYRGLKMEDIEKKWIER